MIMPILDRLLRRLGQRDRQIDKELQFHLDEQMAAHMAAGLSSAEAARRTRLEFGGRQQIAEEVRAVRQWSWLEDARSDIRFALRAYRRAPAFAMMAILTLGLAIGVNTALFSVVRQVLLKMLPVARPHELVEIGCASPPGTAGAVCVPSYLAFQLLAESRDALAGAFAFSPVPYGVVAVVNGRREIITGQLTSGSAFGVLEINAALGRLLTPADDRADANLVAVLGHGYWQRAFGGRADVIGESITLGTQSATVVGVLPPDFRGVTFGAIYDVFLPIGSAGVFHTPGILANPNRGWLTFMGRRHPDASLRQVSERLTPIFRQAAEAAVARLPEERRQRLNLDVRADVRPAAVGSTSGLRRTLQPTLRVLIVVGVLILTFACANLTGLFLARALNRQKELALRFALGAGRARLVRQLLTETVLVGAAGGLLGLLVAQWIAPAGFSLAVGEGDLAAVDLRPDLWLIAFTAAVSVGTGLVAGIAPVLRIPAARPQDALRKLPVHASPRLTKGLLTAQIALTIALVGAAALFLQTLTNFRRIDVGFQPDHLLHVTMDVGTQGLGEAQFGAYMARAQEALAAIPGVQAVTSSNMPIGAGVSQFLMLAVPGYEPSNEPMRNAAGIAFVGPGFARTLGLTLLTGRDILESDRSGSPRVAIVNESFATHFFGRAEVNGRTFSYAPADLNPPFTIVGVVRDARDAGLHRRPGPMMYVAQAQSDARAVSFAVRTVLEPSALAPVVRQALATLDPNVGILRMATAEAQLDDMLRRERLLAALGTAFAGLALLLVAIGLYGMLNGIVLRRTSEIGVRMALGADRGRIGWMLAREAGAILAIGIAAGVAGHIATGRAVRSELFGVMPNDPTPIVAAVGLLALVAVAAVGVPAWRATRIQPAEAVRQDYA
jgi:putative ABC transport system permease protein